MCTQTLASGAADGDKVSGAYSDIPGGRRCLVDFEKA